MRCPFCTEDNDKVVDSRSASDGGVTRRRRECLACKKRYTTYERVEEAPLRVEKSDGTRVAYEREKITKGIMRACEKRPIPTQTIEEIVNRIHDLIEQNFDREVPAAYIGEAVMEQLKELDQIAYVRFASVYRRFEDVADFTRTLEDMKPKS